MAASFVKSFRGLWTPMITNIVFSLMLFGAVLHFVQDVVQVAPPPPALNGAKPPGPPPPPPAPPWQVPAALVPAILLSLINSYWLLLNYLKGQGKKAAEVLAEIRSGQLSARLPEDILSTMGGFNAEFNAMAEELEALVSRLRLVEKNRAEMIQDIGHDIRHPLASIRVALETLEGQSAKLGTEQVARLHSVVLQQSREIEVMLEDLVTLNTLREGWKLKNQECDIFKLCQTLCDEMQTLYPQKKFLLESEHQGELSLELDPQIFRRMIRNALENARRFAQREVHVRCGLDSQSKRLYVEVRDDGEGFSSRAIEWFARTHPQSVIPNHETRESGMGLGSFVMRKLAELLRFRIVLKNFRANEGVLRGACVRFEQKEA